MAQRNSPGIPPKRTKKVRSDVKVVDSVVSKYNAAINVMPKGGGGGDHGTRSGTLNVLGYPRWGVLANFEHNCWLRDREV